MGWEFQLFFTFYRKAIFCQMHPILKQRVNSPWISKFDTLIFYVLCFLATCWHFFFAICLSNSLPVLNFFIFSCFVFHNFLFNCFCGAHQMCVTVQVGEGIRRRRRVKEKRERNATRGGEGGRSVQRKAPPPLFGLFLWARPPPMSNSCTFTASRTAQTLILLLRSAVQLFILSGEREM